MIPDNEFITIKGIPGPTKEEIRCIVMCKSSVSHDDVVVDIGCGTGGLTLEFAKRAKKVYAVDTNKMALTLTFKNLEKHKLEHKVELIHDNGHEALKNIENLDILIIGGSGGDLPLIIKEGFKKLNDGGRILITSILLETPVEAIKTMHELKLMSEVINISVSKGKMLKRGTMMLANNPITIIKAQK
ncbi:MAG: precorrin-6Y C5,15-methyltransferase (decarboxylating) subunit CbiT [Methanobacterium sp.]